MAGCYLISGRQAEAERDTVPAGDLQHLKEVVRVADVRELRERAEQLLNRARELRGHL